MTSRVKLYIALPILLASAGWLYLAFNPIPPKPDVRPHEALGRAMAAQAATVVAPGGKIYLFAPDPVVFRTPAAKAQLESFLSAAQAAKLSIAATKPVKLDPLRLLRLPTGDLLSLSRQLTEKDVVVSFMGPPLLNADQRARLQQIPRVVAACTGDMARQLPLQRIFDSGLLHVAIISNPNAPSVIPTSGDLFPRYYHVITEKNLSELPPPAEGVNAVF
jgi:hypothetical protein